jgi:peptidoglycan-N-acetylglucosamine deacetylase
MFTEAIGGAGLAAAGVLAYGVRGRSSQLFGRTIWKGPPDHRAIALTFDDGPSESTPRLLEVLEEYGVRATFFQCGHHVRRLPEIALRCVSRGHEVENHSDTHPAFFLRSPDFILEQLQRAQQAISETTGQTPVYYRAPFGARWFGVRAAQERLSLTGVMWTAIARDWTLPAGEIVRRMKTRVRPGSILCFHDGRELVHKPDISATIDAVRVLLPHWLEQGYEFLTLSELLSAAPADPAAPSDPSDGPAQQ